MRLAQVKYLCRLLEFLWKTPGISPNVTWRRRVHPCAAISISVLLIISLMFLCSSSCIEEFLSQNSVAITCLADCSKLSRRKGTQSYIFLHLLIALALGMSAIYHYICPSRDQTTVDQWLQDTLDVYFDSHGIYISAFVTKHGKDWVFVQMSCFFAWPNILEKEEIT